MLDVNVYQYSMLARKFASKLESRKSERSGLVMVSSVAAELPGLKTSLTYNATKIFVKYLVQSIAYENSTTSSKRSKIDVLCL